MGNKRVNSILITQPASLDGMIPYNVLGEKWNIVVDFRRFIRVDGLSLNEFRKLNVNPLDFNGIIFTSKVAVDHFFRIINEMRIEMPPETKYYCVGEATYKYLQKYILIRKRKMFVGDKTAMDLIPFIDKFKKEKFLFPCSNVHQGELLVYMKQKEIDVTVAEIYLTVHDDLSDLKEVFYDMICFFAPTGIQSLFKNFPDFKQNDTRIAVFGSTTAQEARLAGLRIDVEAPRPGITSMTAAIEEYLKESNL